MTNTNKPKEFNVYIATGKFFLGLFLIITTLYTVKAAFTDTTLENLEASYNSAILMYGKQKTLTVESIEMERSSADHVCDVYRALKAYKELKKLPLESSENPCVLLKAPQETGEQNLK